MCIFIMTSFRYITFPLVLPNEKNVYFIYSNKSIEVIVMLIAFGSGL